MSLNPLALNQAFWSVARGAAGQPDQPRNLLAPEIFSCCPKFGMQWPVAIPPPIRQKLKGLYP